MLKLLGWFILNLIPWWHRRKALNKRNTWREVKKHQWAVALHAAVVFIGFLILSRISPYFFGGGLAFLGELAGSIFNVWLFRRLAQSDRQVTSDALSSVEVEGKSEERLAAESELDDWLKDNA